MFLQRKKSNGKKGTKERKQKGKPNRRVIEFFPIAGFAVSTRQNEIGPY